MKVDYREARSARRAARSRRRKRRRVIRAAAVAGAVSTVAVASILTVLGGSQDRSPVDRVRLSNSTEALEFIAGTAPFAAGQTGTVIAGSGSAGSGIVAPGASRNLQDPGRPNLLAGSNDGLTLLGIPGGLSAAQAVFAPRSASSDGSASQTDPGSFTRGWSGASAASGTSGRTSRGITSGAGSGSSGGGNPGGPGGQGSPDSSAPDSAAPRVTASGPPAAPPVVTTPNSPAAPPVVNATGPPAASPPTLSPGDSGAPAATPTGDAPGAATPQATPPVIISTGPVEGFGPIAGPVTVAPGGVLSPGASPGELTLNDDFTLFGGILEIDIWGLDPGVDHDLLTILGEAFFVSGAIQFVFTTDDTGDTGPLVFAPTVGETFTFLTAVGGIFGFDGNSDLSLFSLDLAPDLDFIVNNSGNALTLEIIAASNTQLSATTQQEILTTTLGGPVFEVNNGSVSGPLNLHATAVSAPGALTLQVMGVLLLLARFAVRRRPGGTTSRDTV